jgi:hypothetical protein
VCVAARNARRRRKGAAVEVVAVVEEVQEVQEVEEVEAAAAAVAEEEEEEEGRHVGARARGREGRTASAPRAAIDFGRRDWLVYVLAEGAVEPEAARRGDNAIASPSETRDKRQQRHP